MKKKILFRADGNSAIGLGHLYRLFALVEMFKSNFDCLFITKESSSTSVIPITYKFLLIPDTISIEEEPKWLLNQFNPEDCLIVVDGYQFNSKYQKKIKQGGFSLVFIDDLTTEYMYADLVINHSPYVTEKDFKGEQYTTFALGTDYAILRPLFLEATKMKRIVNKIDTVFVCFGGADPMDLSLKTTLAALSFPEINEINVVLGGAYSHSKIFELKKNNSKVKIYKNLDEKELVTLMQHCNFAIVPASTILYEICTIKMPILSGFFIDNQKLIYSGFVDNSAIFKGGDFSNYTIKDFSNKIQAIINMADFKPQIKAQEILFNEKIKENHLNIIKKLC